jgi:hypothetical protein
MTVTWWSASWSSVNKLSGGRLHPRSRAMPGLPRSRRRAARPGQPVPAPARHHRRWCRR